MQRWNHQGLSPNSKKARNMDHIRDFQPLFIPSIYLPRFGLWRMMPPVSNHLLPLRPDYSSEIILIMSHNIPRGMPWIDWEEWTTVKNFIYSRNVKDQITALECVAAWRLRGKLPHSIESTAQLLEVLQIICCIGYCNRSNSWLPHSAIDPQGYQSVQRPFHFSPFPDSSLRLHPNYIRLASTIIPITSTYLVRYGDLKVSYACSTLLPSFAQWTVSLMAPSKVITNCQILRPNHESKIAFIPWADWIRF